MEPLEWRRTRMWPLPHGPSGTPPTRALGRCPARAPRRRRGSLPTPAARHLDTAAVISPGALLPQHSAPCCTSIAARRLSPRSVRLPPLGRVCAITRVGQAAPVAAPLSRTPRGPFCAGSRAPWIGGRRPWAAATAPAAWLPMEPDPASFGPATKARTRVRPPRRAPLRRGGAQAARTRATRGRAAAGPRGALGRLGPRPRPPCSPAAAAAHEAPQAPTHDTPCPHRFLTNWA